MRDASSHKRQIYLAVGLPQLLKMTQGEILHTLQRIVMFVTKVSR